MDRRIQVVLGEAEPDAGFLRFVLEGEGFDLVGLASSDEELDRVMEGARPSVIVLDAGISAMAALRAKERMPGATIVTVWPDDVAAPLADERVAPFEVVDSLGAAVRQAATRAQIPEPTVDVAVVLGNAIREWRTAKPTPKPVSLPRSVEPDESPRRTGRKVLVLAATWILILTALATIATAIPKALEARSPAPTRMEVTHPTPSNIPLLMRPDLRVVQGGEAGFASQRR
jgi:chemotaxis response regulator CheB